MWRQLSMVTRPGDGPNEDRVGVEGPLAWVLDGATPLTPDRIAPDCPTDAVWLVERLESGLRKRATSTVPLSDLLADAISEVAAAAENDWLHTPEVPPSAAVGLARLDGSRMEYLVLADVSVVFEGANGVVEITDDRPDELNAEATERLTSLLGAGIGHETAMEEVRPLLVRHRLTRMNTEGGYWVAALDPAAASHALMGEMEPASRTLLASDGFARGPNLFELWDWENPLGHPERLELLADEVRAAESGDSGCQAFPRWNTSDDLIATVVEPIQRNA